jgi:hypothetical protein
MMKSTHLPGALALALFTVAVLPQPGLRADESAAAADTHTVTNFALGQTDPYNPAGSPSQQQNQYTFRPRTFGVTVTWHGPG